MTTVIRTRIGQGTLVHIVPMGSGQLFLVGHMSLNFSYTVRDRKPCYQTAYVIIYQCTALAHKTREKTQSPFLHLLLHSRQDDRVRCP